MLSLQKAKKHESFDFEVNMTKKVMRNLQRDLDSLQIVHSDVMSDKFNDNSFGIRIDNMEIYYDQEKSEYYVFEELYYAGDYWNPPDINVEVAGIFASYGKALEFVIRVLATRNISDFIESEYEKHLDSLPQGEWCAT